MTPRNRLSSIARALFAELSSPPPPSLCTATYGNYDVYRDAQARSRAISVLYTRVYMCVYTLACREDVGIFLPPVRGSLSLMRKVFYADFCKYTGACRIVKRSEKERSGGADVFVRDE